jgi:PAS domain S-box-containing protein
MAEIGSTKGLKTLDDLLHLVARHEILVIAVPYSGLSQRLVELTLRAVNRDENKAHLVSFGGKAEFPAAARPATSLSLQSAKSVDAAIAALRGYLPRFGKNSTVVLDLLQRYPDWADSDERREKFLQSALSVLSKREVLTVVAAPVDFIADGQWARAKTSSKVFLRILPVGLSYYGVFLKAEGVYSSEFFLPRKLVLADTFLNFGEPSVPTLEVPADLPPALTSAERPDVVDELELSYRKVFDSSPDGVVLFDLKGRYREVNQRAAEMFGFTPEEFRAVPVSLIVPPVQLQKFLRAAAMLRRKGKVLEDLELLRKSRRPVFLAVAAGLVDRGRYMAVLRETGEKVKELEQTKSAARYYEGLFADSIHPQAVVSNRKIVHCNKAFVKTFASQDGGSLEGKSLLELLGKRNSDFVRELFNPETGRDGQHFTRDIIVSHRDAPQKRFEVSAFPFKGDETRSFLLALVDISARIDALHIVEESEKRFRGLVESAAGAVSVVRDGKFVYVNYGFLQLFGFSSPAELLGNEITITVPKRERENLLENSRPADAVGGEPASFHYAGVRKDGTPLQLEASTETIIYAGTPALLGYHRDISEQKAYDEQVRRKAHIHQVLDHLIDALANVTTAVDVVKLGLDASMRWLGYESGGVYTSGPNSGEFMLQIQSGFPAKIVNMLHVQSKTEGVTGYVAKTLEPLLLTPAEYPAHLPYRSLFESERLETVVYIPLVAGEEAVGILILGTPKRMASQIRDLEILASFGTHFGASVARAIRFDDLKLSEQRYRSAIEGLLDIVYQTQPSGAFQYLSPQIESVFGYAAAEFLRNADAWRTAVHPDDRSIYSRRISSHVEGLEAIELEYRFLPKGKAAYRWIRDAVRYTRNESGEVVSIQGTVSDITRQVEAAGAVTTFEDLKGGVLDALPEAVVLYDRDHVCTGWNLALERVTGILGIQMVGKRIAEGASPFDPEAAEAHVARAFDGESLVAEVPFSPGGSDGGKVLSARFSPIRDRSGSVIAVLCVAVDVSGKKAAEREAAESEAALREVINAMGDALMISDLQGRIREVNQEFVRLTGYNRQEVLGLEFPYPWLVEEETPRFVRWIFELREKGFLKDFDMTWRHKDGHETAISLNTTLFRNVKGEPVAMLNIARDIGERLRLINELATRSKQIEMLNRIISKANRTVDFSDIFQSISQEVAKLLQYDEINVGIISEDEKSMTMLARAGEGIPSVHLGTTVSLDRTVSQLAIHRGEAIVIGNLSSHPELGNRVYSVKEGLKSQICIPIVLNEKILGTLSVGSVEENAYRQEDVPVLLPIADQIGSMIDRARLFQKVSDDSKYIHNLLNSIDSIVFTVDEGYRIREVNEAWRQYAALKQLENYREESSVLGAALEKVVANPVVWGELQRIMPQLFGGSLKIYATEVQLGEAPWTRIFRLVVNPMAISGRVTGLVFSHTDITEIVRAKEEIDRRNEELMALNAISSSITKSLNLDEVLDVAFSRVRDMLKAEIVLCYLKDEETGKLTLARTFGISAEQAKRIGVLRVARRSLHSPSEEREPLVISGLSLTDERATPSVRLLFETLGQKELVALPLQSKDRVLGALVLELSGGQSLYEEQKRFLSLLGNQLGSALENAQLYAEVQAQVQRITSLYELGKGLTGALDTRALLELVHAQVVKSIPLREFAYHTYLHRPFTLRVLFRAFWDEAGEHVDQGHAEDVPIEKGSPEWSVATTGVPYLRSPADGAPRMIVPVKSQQRVVGLVSVTGPPGSHYRLSYLRLLESIANLTEIALDRVALYEDTVTKSREIEARNRELDDFAYVVSHDLKEPLITIEGYSKIILGDYRQNLPPDGQQYLHSVVQSSGRMKSLIEDLLTLSRVGRVSEAPEVVPLRLVIEDVLRDFEFTFRERNVEVHVPESLPEVRYSSTQLSMVFRNLISNAVKFNVESKPEITISICEEPNEYLVSVQDNGIGVAPEHFDRIFVIFQRLNRAEDYQGTGAGLTIVKKIVERHGGRIWVDSEVGKGTTFYFTIPR